MNEKLETLARYQQGIKEINALASQGRVVDVINSLSVAYERVFDEYRDACLRAEQLEKRARQGSSASIEQELAEKKQLAERLHLWLADYEPSGGKYKEIVETARDNARLNLHYSEEQAEFFSIELQEFRNAIARGSSHGDVFFTRALCQMSFHHLLEKKQSLSKRISGINADIAGTSDYYKREAMQDKKNFLISFLSEVSAHLTRIGESNRRFIALSEQNSHKK